MSLSDFESYSLQSTPTISTTLTVVARVSVLTPTGDEDALGDAGTAVTAAYVACRIAHRCVRISDQGRRR